MLWLRLVAEFVLFNEFAETAIFLYSYKHLLLSKTELNEVKRINGKCFENDSFKVIMVK